MNIKLFDRNISAVSLIEIMMIFTIIGVVTTACIGLAKPKYEYMKKIKLFSALDMLENAAKIIQQEGSIDYTSDINTCSNRSGNYCTDYDNQYPHLNNQLPKASYRSQKDTTASLNKTIYSKLNATEQSQFQNLQKGLCDRLQKVFVTQGYKKQSCAAADLIEDSNIANIRGNGYFKNKTPQIILPNGQALFISKHLYTDYGSNRYIVYATTQETGYDNYTESVAVGTDNCTGYHGLGCARLSSYVSGLPNGHNILMSQPNETRLAAAEYSVGVTSAARDVKKLYARNKDYFVIYVDTNCQMHNGNNSDKMCGSDTLNDDVFAFRMYRDGTVIPDESTSFPANMLTARVLIQDSNDEEGKFKVSNVNYANLPLNKARCYANLMCNGINNNAICSICNNYAQVYNPLSECVTPSGDSKCKVIINKPSFVMR